MSMLLVLPVLAAAAAGFGSQLARVADRIPDMISLVAQQLSQTGAGADSLLARARQAFSELDRAVERTNGVRPAVPSRRRTAVAAAAAASAAEANAAVDTAKTATVVLRETAVSGSGALLRFACDLTLIIFVGFFTLAGSA